MKTIVKDLGSKKPNYPIENLAKLEEILFLDIETTGFTAHTIKRMNGTPSSGLPKIMMKKRLFYRHSLNSA